MKRSVWIGFDPREAAAFAVARQSIRRHLSSDIEINGLILRDLQAMGLFRRPLDQRDGRTWDVISDAPCSTEFSNSRFLVKELAGPEAGWALFMDCDMLVRADIHEVFDLCDPTRAVMCVKHDHRPAEGTKMDGMMQTAYPRKNWSSFFVVQVGHPANERLTVEMVNSLPGRDLHRFAWLEDDEIGALPEEWNWLAGHSDPAIVPKNCHHTEGSPALPGYEDAPFAHEWREVLAEWAAGATEAERC